MTTITPSKPGETMSETTIPSATSSATKEFLAEADKHILDMVKMQRSLALAQAEKALAQNESAELRYNNIVIQLTVKYKLTSNDTITEQGEILRNVNTAKQDNK